MALSEIFWKLHEGLDQQGPGNDKLTLLALNMVEEITEPKNILDVGCGPGRQTILLAQHTSAQVTALDNHQPFLDQLNNRAKEAELSNKITTVNQSMTAMDFASESFDLIWSEGAIYCMGFAEGLKEFGRFLKPGGFVAVTEATWLSENRPSEVEEFWKMAYPAMTTKDKNLQTIIETGYNSIGEFTLSKSCWENYYAPIRERIEKFRQQYCGKPEEIACLEEEQAEIDLYDRFSDQYGYVFYIMRKQ